MKTGTVLRHRMSRHLFFAAPFLLAVLFFGVGGVCAQEIPVERVTLFEGGKTAIPTVDKNGAKTKVFDAFRDPALVYAGGMLVAIAEGQCKEGKEENCVGLVAKSLFTGGTVWSSGSALLLERHGKRDFSSSLLSPTVIVEDESRNVTVVLGGYGASGQSLTETSTSGRDFRQAIGYGDKATAEDPRTTLFKWEQKIQTLADTSMDTSGTDLKEELKKRSLQQFTGAGGAAIRMADGTFVLPVQALGNDKNAVSLILTFSTPGYGWKLSKGTSAKGCTNPAVVEWEENKLLMITTCAEGHRKVYESTDKGETWTEAIETLSRVWGNAQEREGTGSRGGFITAEIDGKKVMLFAHSVRKDGGEHGQLRLWMTDNTRILNVGLISTKAEKTGASSLLYRDNQLYCLYEVNERNSDSLVFANLTNALGRIKHVLQRWATVDKSLSERCGAHRENTGLSGAACASPISTTGLLGFLSNESTSDHWYDEYRCVGANVKGATKIPNGLVFEGAGAGARWPVGKQGQSQRYLFANQGFTLAATVAVHETPSGAIPLLSASLDESGVNKLLALSITPQRTLECTFGGVWIMSSEQWELHKEYQVVLLWRNGKSNIYVDGTAMAGSYAKCGEDSVDIKHFSLGGYGTAELNITGKVSVTNALLYNRALNKTEVEALLQIKDTHQVPASSTSLDRSTDAGQSNGHKRRRFARAAHVSGADPADDFDFPKILLKSTDKGGDSTVRDHLSHVLPLLLALCWIAVLC